MSTGNAVPPSFEFGRCQMSLRRRELRRGGQLVEVGSRTFDILVTLIECRGRVVSKDELMGSVWPGRIVEENTLEAQVSALRRALGEDRVLVRTVSGRGYQFTGELTVLEPSEDPTPLLVDNLPVGVTPLIGRDTAILQIAQIAADRRLITLVGSGGVGKTRLAIEVARALASRFPEGMALIELGPLGTPEFVPAAVAEALGFPQGAGTPSLDRIASLISTRRMLLILDNCEHLMEAAAQMAEKLLEAGAGLSIIATSREPLRASGEYVYRVPSLEVPAEENLNAEDILRHSALRLFSARAGGIARLQGDDIAAALAARICRQLDGIPLAIELAAARVAMFGVEGVAARVEDCFSLLTSGARTALPRQRTLRAAFDWSFDLLHGSEKAVLARLGVFTGIFSLDAATSVVCAGDMTPAEVVDCVTRLVETSLVSVVAGTPMQYRLLETTRLYARDKLGEAGVINEFSLRHAQYHADLLRRAEQDWEKLPTDQWVALYGRLLEGVRGAIEWSFSSEGRSSLGVELTASAIPLWMQMGLLEELMARVDTALARIGKDGVVDSKSILKLHAAQGAARLYQSARVDGDTPFGQALELAERLDDKDHQLRAIWGLWSVSYLRGQYEPALALSHRFAEAAAAGPHPADRLVGDRMTGTALICLGRLAEGRHYLQRVVDDYVAPLHCSHLIRFIYDQKTVARSALSHVLWLQGFPDQAAAMAAHAIEDARAIDHPPSLCYATESACAIAVLCGLTSALESAADQAVEATRRHGISTWKARGRMWRGLQLLCAGDTLAYERDLLPALQEIGDALFMMHYTGFISATCEQLGSHGLVAEAIELGQRALERAQRADDKCSMAELLRLVAGLSARAGSSDQQVEAQLEEAMAASREQESLAWQLRCATSLAQARQRRGAHQEARELLAPIYAEFTEGFDSADLRHARLVLQSVGAQAAVLNRHFREPPG